MSAITQSSCYHLGSDKTLHSHPTLSTTKAKALSDLRKLPRNQLTRLTKEDLIESILTRPEPNEDFVRDLTDKMNKLVSEVAEIKQAITAPDSFINKRYDELQRQVDQQADIIAKQQRYLEFLDRKERENNVVITGVPDENEALAGVTSEDRKLNKIWASMDVREEIQSHRRLGVRGDANVRRPILLTVASKIARDRILEKTNLLKTAGGEFSRIFVKKDVHPCIRKEWRRLHGAEKTEKERPENAGCGIRLDYRERKLYRDEAVIDSWNLQSF